MTVMEGLANWTVAIDVLGLVITFAPNQHGKGVGKGLVLAAESFCAQLGATDIVLNARQPVVPFYEALGYQALGSVFYEVTIPHLKMTKKLDAAIKKP